MSLYLLFYVLVGLIVGTISGTLVGGFFLRMQKSKKPWYHPYRNPEELYLALGHIDIHRREKL